jgi:hypothetical protein
MRHASQGSGYRVVLQRGYWDKLTFLRQQGLPLREDVIALGVAACRFGEGSA